MGVGALRGTRGQGRQRGRARGGRAAAGAVLLGALLGPLVLASPAQAVPAAPSGSGPLVPDPPAPPVPWTLEVQPPAGSCTYGQMYAVVGSVVRCTGTPVRHRAVVLCLDPGPASPLPTSDVGPWVRPGQTSVAVCPAGTGMAVRSVQFETAPVS